MTGTVTLRLYKGGCLPVARSAARSLYREELATFGDDAVYDQTDAAGFIRLWGLPTRVHAAVHGPAGAAVAGGPAGADAAGEPAPVRGAAASPRRPAPAMAGDA